MTEKIIKKPFFYKTRFNRTYCSICGKLIPGDYYNMKKHLKLHHGIDNPEVICMRENKDYAYAFKTDEAHHKLTIYIFIPVMVERPGFEGTHNFIGGEWRQIYVAALYEGAKKIDNLEQISDMFTSVEIIMNLIDWCIRNGKQVVVTTTMETRQIDAPGIGMMMAKWWRALEMRLFKHI